MLELAPAPALPAPPRTRAPVRKHADFAAGLVLSSPPRRAAPLGAGLSALVHGAVFLLLVEIAGRAAQGAAPELASETMPFFVVGPTQSPDKAPPAPRPAPQPVESPGRTDGIPVARGFQVIQAASEIPPVIPPVDLNQKPLDPRNYSGAGVEGGVADGIEGGVRVDEVPEVIATAVPGTGMVPVYRAEELRETARLITQEPPAYPPVLRAAGIEGFVRLQFIVDTLGRVEPASVSVVESSDPAFERAARQSLPGARFSPARFGGRAVRQLSSQRFNFRIRAP